MVIESLVLIISTQNRYSLHKMHKNAFNGKNNIIKLHGRGHAMTRKLKIEKIRNCSILIIQVDKHSY